MAVKEEATKKSSNLSKEEKIQYKLTKIGSKHIVASYKKSDGMAQGAGDSVERYFMEFCEGGTFQKLLSNMDYNWIPEKIHWWVLASDHW